MTTSMHVHHHHDSFLVLVSVAIAIFASYSALDLANSLTSAIGRAKSFWLFGGSLSMGFGIWSMHFVGMLAFSLPGVEIAYDVPLMLLSILVAISASILALYILSKKTVYISSYVFGSLAMGAAIAGMHYIGIASMRLGATYTWDYSLVALSIVIAVGASFGALYLAVKLRGDESRRGLIYRLLAGTLMGFAISGMHYTGMLAMHFDLAEPLRIQNEQLLATKGLAIAVICTSVLITAIALTGTIMERTLARKARIASQIQGIIESLADGFFSVDFRWRFLYVNEVARKLIKRFKPAEDFDPIGMSLWEVVPLMSQSSFEKHIREAMTKREARHHEEFFAPLGLWIELRAYPSPDGLSVIFRDITDRKKLEEENARLYSESQNVNRIKDEFLATLSHELRTPLNVIQGNAEILMTEGGSQLSQDMKSSVEAIYRNARAQTSIIADLLDVSSIITGKFGFEPTEISPREIVEVVAANNRHTAESKGVHLVCEISNAPEKIIGDATRLQQILWNLVTNAIKFTPRGGSVFLRLSGSGDGSGDGSSEECIFQVSDTGKGILPEFLPYVFERFRQEDSSTTRKYGGLGLGLAIVRHLVEMHGGTVRAESAGINQGTTFTVTLPIKMKFEEYVKPVQAIPASKVDRNYGLDFELNGLKILLVDDSEDTRLLLRRVLEKHEGEVHEADSAEAARMALESYKPDVILSDIGMPHEDGMEFIRKFRESERASRSGPIPAIALTAYARMEEREAAIAAGFNAHVSKPVSKDELLSAIREVMRETRTARGSGSPHAGK